MILMVLDKYDHHFRVIILNPHPWFYIDHECYVSIRSKFGAVQLSKRGPAG